MDPFDELCERLMIRIDAPLAKRQVPEISQKRVQSTECWIHCVALAVRADRNQTERLGVPPPPSV